MKCYVNLKDGLELFMSLLEPWSISHEWLLYASSWHKYTSLAVGSAIETFCQLFKLILNLLLDKVWFLQGRTIVLSSSQLCRFAFKLRYECWALLVGAVASMINWVVCSVWAEPHDKPRTSASLWHYYYLWGLHSNRYKSMKLIDLIRNL